ncbi:MAG: hypothetical protein M1822_007478 [Bathelium mastoideum]|nr:MAG: hypothetical protein M1822_007478 [Bathelium mastoideum]
MASSPATPWTYRVQHVPPGTTAEQFENVFDKGDYSICKIRTLVPSADETDGTLVATILYACKDGKKRPPHLKDETLRVDAEFHGLTALNRPEEPIEADIVAVTGLAGHAFGSWASSHDVMWLRDFLPKDFPNVAVYTYGYDSTLQQSHSRSILADHADAFVQRFSAMRRKKSSADRPCIFIGHSLGCLIIEKLSDHKEWEPLSQLSAAIFFGAPNGGLETKTLESLVDGQPSADLVDQLKPDSPTIRDLKKDFLKVARDIKILSIYELKESKTVVKNSDGKWTRDGPLQMMVNYQSAILNFPDETSLPYDRDHSGIAKLERGETGIYPSVSDFISRFVVDDNVKSSFGLRPNKVSQDTLVDQLCFPEMDHRQGEITDAHRNTFQWIFKDSTSLLSRKQNQHSKNDISDRSEWYDFGKWLREDSEIYWISGKAGSGKSTLMRFIGEDSRTRSALKSWTGSRKLLMPAFFFWNPGVALQREFQGLLRSVIVQIVKFNLKLKELLRAPATKLSTSGVTIPSWTEDQLLSTLKRMIQHEAESTCFCLFIDGLDEADGDYHSFVDMLLLLAGCPNCKLCISSRPLEVFKQTFRQAPQLRLQDLTLSDIKAVIDDKLFPRLELAYPGEERVVHELCLALGDRAEGVFLWVSLMIRHLTQTIQQRCSLEDLRQELNRTPSDIEELYTHMLGRLSPADMESALLYLQCMGFWQRHIDTLCLTDCDNLLMMTLANDDNWQKISNCDNTSDIYARLIHSCKMVGLCINRQCAGILEVDEDIGLEADHLSWIDKQRERYRKNASNSRVWCAYLKRHHMSHTGNIKFIHKTAFDYIIDDAFKSLLNKKSMHQYATHIPEAYTLSGYMRARRACLADLFWKTWISNEIFVFLGKELDRLAREGIIDRDAASVLMTELDWLLHLPKLETLSTPPSESHLPKKAVYSDPRLQDLWRNPAHHFLGWYIFHSFDYLAMTQLQNLSPFKAEELNFFLWCAVNRQHDRCDSESILEIVRFLLEKGANPNALFLPMLMYSTMSKCTSTLGSFCGNLLHSIDEASLSLLRILVDAGGDVNTSCWIFLTYGPLKKDISRELGSFLKHLRL